MPAARGSDAITVACLTDVPWPLLRVLGCEVLTRAGAAVTVASVEESLTLRLGSLTLQADVALEACRETEWAAIACPGGEVGVREACLGMESLQEL